jgi:transcriptional regulator with XRE-family HTH domain
VFGQELTGMAKRLSGTGRLRATFAENLRRVRSKRFLSQEKLAELTGLHRTYVGSVERGERNISIDNVERFLLALDVPVSELLSDD